MLGYFLTSPFFGYLGDRVARKWLIALGIFVWSVGTVLTGFAASFTVLLLFRARVGSVRRAMRPGKWSVHTLCVRLILHFATSPVIVVSAAAFGRIHSSNRAWALRAALRSIFPKPTLELQPHTQPFGPSPGFA